MGILDAVWESLPPEARRSYASVPEGMAWLYRNLSTAGAIQDTVEALQDTGRSAVAGEGWGTATNLAKAAGAAVGVVPGGKLAVKGGKRLGEELITPLINKGILAPFEAKAPRGGFTSDLSETSYPISVDDMRFARTSNTPMVPPKVISPEELQGGLLAPAIGDRTMAGHSLTGINDKPLAFPVNLQGGPNFMRGPQQVADSAFWASNPSPNTTMTNKLRGLLDSGDPVNLVYTTMGSRSGDFSHMMSDTLLAQIPNAPITKTAMIEFDRALRKTNPAWPGFMKRDGSAWKTADMDELRKVLAEDGVLRKDMVEEIALGKWRDKGFPDIASSRAAITEPELLREPGTGASGYTIARVTDPRVIDNPTVPHATYPSQIGGGQYVGGFETQVPRSVMWPDAYARMAEEGKKPTQLDYTFGRRLPVQRADQEWLDGVMKWLSRSSEGR